MHESVHAWVARQVLSCDLAKMDTLEVGSLDVNGSIRHLFSGSYVGVDMRDGPGVDLLAIASHLPFDRASFNVVVSTEMIEHDPTFWLSMAEMGRVLRPRGHLLLTTRGNGFQEHLEPSDYWRFMPNARALLLELASCDPVSEELDPQVPGIFIHGIRR